MTAPISEADPSTEKTEEHILTKSSSGSGEAEQIIFPSHSRCPQMPRHTFTRLHCCEDKDPANRIPVLSFQGPQSKLSGRNEVKDKVSSGFLRHELRLPWVRSPWAHFTRAFWKKASFVVHCRAGQ